MFAITTASKLESKVVDYICATNNEVNIITYSFYTRSISCKWLLYPKVNFSYQDYKHHGDLKLCFLPMVSDSNFHFKTWGKSWNWFDTVLEQIFYLTYHNLSNESFSASGMFQWDVKDKISINYLPDYFSFPYRIRCLLKAT